MLALALSVHSMLRWVVLIFGLLAVIRAWQGRLSRRPWTPADRKAGLAFSLALDVQFLIGLTLFFTSPITRMGMQAPGAMMQSSVARFFTVEHPFIMLIAIGVLHMGRSRLRKSSTDAARHRTASIFFTVALLLLLAGIPWPFLPYGRLWVTWPW